MWKIQEQTDDGVLIDGPYTTKHPHQHSCLENPKDRGAWQAAVHWVTESWTTEVAKQSNSIQLNRLECLLDHSCIMSQCPQPVLPTIHLLGGSLVIKARQQVISRSNKNGGKTLSHIPQKPWGVWPLLESSLKRQESSQTSFHFWWIKKKYLLFRSIQVYCCPFLAISLSLSLIHWHYLQMKVLL